MCSLWALVSDFSHRVVTTLILALPPKGLWRCLCNIINMWHHQQTYHLNVQMVGLLEMVISTCLFVSHLSFLVSLHIVVVCIVFMAISLRFAKGLLLLSFFELWSASRPILMAFQVLLGVLVHGSSLLAWVLCCFVWLWCFIAHVVGSSLWL
jgi:hypothetical protein